MHTADSGPSLINRGVRILRAGERVTAASWNDTREWINQQSFVPPPRQVFGTRIPPPPVQLGDGWAAIILNPDNGGLGDETGLWVWVRPMVFQGDREPPLVPRWEFVDDPVVAIVQPNLPLEVFFRPLVVENVPFTLQNRKKIVLQHTFFVDGVLNVALTQPLVFVDRVIDAERSECGAVNGGLG